MEDSDRTAPNREDFRHLTVCRCVFQHGALSYMFEGELGPFWGEYGAVRFWGYACRACVPLRLGREESKRTAPYQEAFRHLAVCRCVPPRTLLRSMCFWGECGAFQGECGAFLGEVKKLTCAALCVQCGSARVQGHRRRAARARTAQRQHRAGRAHRRRDSLHASWLCHGRGSVSEVHVCLPGATPHRHAAQASY